MGCIEVICGSMFSGKTEKLIRRVKRAKIAKQKIAIFKPTIDIRYSEKNVVSHDDTVIDAKPIDNAYAILEYSDDAQVVAIDEAQFFDESIIDVCTQLANNGKRVIVAGLDMDFMGKPFGFMPQLMAIAEEVTKVKAICVRCGNLAHFSHRLVKNNNLVVLGETDSYEPLCRKCYMQLTK